MIRPLPTAIGPATALLLSQFCLVTPATAQDPDRVYCTGKVYEESATSRVTQEQKTYYYCRGQWIEPVEGFDAHFQKCPDLFGARTCATQTSEFELRPIGDGRFVYTGKHIGDYKGSFLGLLNCEITLNSGGCQGE